MSERTDRDSWVKRVLGLDVADAVSRERDAGAGSNGATGAEGWRTAREGVVGQLQSLEAAIRGMDDPLSNPAIILVKAIAANLTVEPSTPQQIAELRNYLTTDSVIDDAEVPNGFGIKISIRAPLIAALDAMTVGRA